MKIPAQDKIANEMYEAAAGENTKPARHYLGMSGIGDPCERKQWLSFRGYTPIPASGRAKMIFRFGDRIEEEVIHFLRQAGYPVEGQQESFEDHAGMFRGHCDGIIHGVTSRPHLLEIKSANDKKFKSFKDFGVRKTYEVYYAQVQCYMGYSGLDRALFLVQNKNNSEIYTERLYFMKDDFEAFREKAYRIITANEIPDRAFDQESFNCKWCDHRINCWNPQEAIVANAVCGTCYYMGWMGLQKVCRHPAHTVEIHQWGVGCQEWVNEWGPEEDNEYPVRVALEDVKIEKF